VVLGSSHQHRSLLASVATLLVTPVTTAATFHVYRWVDQDGAIHLSNEIPLPAGVEARDRLWLVMEPNSTMYRDTERLQLALVDERYAGAANGSWRLDTRFTARTLLSGSSRGVDGAQGLLGEWRTPRRPAGSPNSPMDGLT
jgi:hypothetical protein